MDGLNLCSKCEIGKLITSFYFRKDSEKYRNEGKQCLNDKRKRRRKNKSEKTKTYKRDYFTENEKQILGNRRNRHHKIAKCRIIHKLGRRHNRALINIVKTSYTEAKLGNEIDL